MPGQEAVNPQVKWDDGTWFIRLPQEVPILTKVATPERSNAITLLSVAFPSRFPPQGYHHRRPCGKTREHGARATRDPSRVGAARAPSSPPVIAAWCPRRGAPPGPAPKTWGSLRVIRWALRTVGSPTIACQDSTGSWVVTRVDFMRQRSSQMSRSHGEILEQL